jgi:hypothetical protein
MFTKEQNQSLHPLVPSLSLLDLVQEITTDVHTKLFDPKNNTTNISKADEDKLHLEASGTELAYRDDTGTSFQNIHVFENLHKSRL